MSRRTRISRTLGRISSPLLRPVLSGRSLSVLCYHRVVERVEPGMFPELNSARPDVFEQHLDVIGEDHTFVSESDIHAWLQDKGSLPARPVLLTFDDGYRDNHDVVFPMLRRRGIPATFFLATGHMDSGEPQWWDRACALIAASALESADLPLLGTRDLGESSRLHLARAWIEAAKKVPDDHRRDAVEALPDALGVTSLEWPEVSMDWDDAREMAADGMTFGGHTHTHPILSRMEVSRAHEDIRVGLERIRDELGISATSFAYPNGGRDDFTDETKRSVAEMGISLAYSLSAGPALRGEVRRDPLAVRRIYIGEGDDADSLKLKLLGAGRAAARIRRS